MNKRIGVVLCNLGGPDSLAAVEPYLFNLFNDPAIIGAPGPVRWMIAKIISKTRAKKSQGNYAKMGGASPILAETRKQAEALEAVLAGRPAFASARPKVVVAMRHWTPFTRDAVSALRSEGIEDVVLLPLYPQYSSTTTGSAVKEFARLWKKPFRTICCYPDLDGVARAYAEVIIETWRNAGSPDNLRVLYSAHGLPESIVAKGDPYVAQCQRTAAAIDAHLPKSFRTKLCYQSRVGPAKWVGPSTDESIIEVAKAKAPVLVCPIAFVSEHVETLVDLDLETAALARQNGVPVYLRAPALGLRDAFIGGLADLVEGSMTKACGVAPSAGDGPCKASHKLCPRRNPALVSV